MSTLDIGAIESFGFGNDPIVIRKYIAGIQGGRVLDVSDFTEEFIRAGHLIIVKPAANDTEKDVYKPMPVSGEAYGTLPTGYEYAGVCTASKSAKEPIVGIMYNGEVNDVASPYPLTDAIKTALKAAIPTLTFKHD